MTTGHPREALQDVTALVRAAQGGDGRALEQLLAIHLPLIYNIVGRALSAGTDVDDVVQETMLRAVRGLAKLREPERFRSWVVAIAYRQLQQHHRGREVSSHQDVADVVDPLTDFAERTVAELVLAGQRRELARAARWLDPTDRQLLALWWQEVSGRLTRPELAAALGVSPRHAAVRVRRMKIQLDEARAVVRALDATPRCTELAGTTRDWDGSTAPVWRKRLTRHTRTCAQCEGHRDGLVPPEKLLPGFGVLLVPDTLLDGVRTGLGQAGDLAGHAAAHWLPATAAVALAVTITYAVWPSSAPDAPPARSGSISQTATSPAAASAPSEPATTAGVLSADIYVAPNGSDSGDGTLFRPFATLGKAVAAVRPGQTIALRGGTYRPTEPVNITVDGTAGQRITLSNYRNERPVIDASAVPATSWAVTQQSRYWTVQGLEISGSTSHAYVCRSCQYMVFRRLSFHGNARSGLILRDAGTVGNAVLDSDFFDNHDPADRGRSGTGLAVTFGSGDGNVIRGCRSYHNATDGIDLGGFTSPVTVDSNWSYGNGVNRWQVPGWQSHGNGFTFGGSGRSPVAHLVSNNAAWDNTGLGFNDEGNPGRIVLTANTAFRNGGTGFYLPDAAAVLNRNAAEGNGRDTQLGTAVRSDANSWQAGRRGTEIFATTDPRTAEAARPADGGLPPTRFLTTGDRTGATMTEIR